MKETKEIDLSDSKCLIYSKNNDFSYIISDKVFELGAINHTIFDDESIFLNDLKTHSVDCLILFFTSFSRDSKSLIDRVSKTKPEVKLIVISKSDIIKSDHFEFMTFESFLKIARTEVDTPYIAVSIEESMDMSSSPCDIYIRISNSKFVKLFKKGVAISLSEIDKYSHRSKDYLFIKKEDSTSFYKKVIDGVVQKSSLGLNSNEFDYVSQIIKTLVPLSISLKIPQSVVIGVVDCHVDVFRELSNLADDSSKFVNEMKDSGRINHMILSSLISAIIIKNLEWGSNNNERKVIKCAAFHDISLKVLEQENTGHDTSLNFSKYKMHPIRSAEMLGGLSFIDNDIITMIEQHHESGDGSGFPRA
ncbi:HD domain-containing phosphohydrolase, partial [Halobacteriovorax sp.]|uniref:HD domain-containing phosphohydrolase n=1 Tax=Halobacteriovorax sp. TaxID=2020862 RepID=UPI003562FE6A